MLKDIYKWLYNVMGGKEMKIVKFLIINLFILSITIFLAGCGENTLRLVVEILMNTRWKKQLIMLINCFLHM